MKVFIIAIDALEYYYIKKRKYFKNLRQVEFGKVDPCNPELLSPIIWSSFLTGKTSEEHGVDRIPFNNSFGDVLNFGLKVLNYFNIKPGFSTQYKIRKFFGINKIFPKPKGKTFLDFAESKCVNFPCINYDFEEGAQPTYDWSLGKISVYKMKRQLFKAQEKYERDVFESLDDDWNLFACYFPLLDFVQHILYFDKNVVEKTYEIMDSFVKKIKDFLSKDDIILIVSDHGSVNVIEDKSLIGDFGHPSHSNWGYYSINRKMNLKNPRIIDFFNIIRNFFGALTEEEEEKIKKHLRELGYF